MAIRRAVRRFTQLPVRAAVRDVRTRLHARGKATASWIDSQSPWLSQIAPVLIGLLALVLYVRGVEIQGTIDPTTVQVNQGSRYWLDLDAVDWRFRLPLGDTSETPFRSTLRVTEDGIVLGPAHTQHAEIAEQGRGRFSHWHNTLYFSTSDGTNPRSNGRRYEVTATWRLSPMALLGILAACCLVSPTARRSLANESSKARRIARHAGARPYLFVGLAIAFIAYYNHYLIVRLDVVPLTWPDSGGYLNGTESRTPGYVLLLGAFRVLVRDWAWLPAFQLNMMLCSIVLLGYSVSRVANHYLPGIALLFLVAQTDQLFHMSLHVLTEASFVAFFTAHVALAVLALARFSSTVLLVSGLSLLVAAAIKPVAMALVVPAGLAAMLMPERRRVAVLLLLLPALCYHFGLSTYNYVHGRSFDTSTIGPAALLGHVAWNVKADPSSRYPELSAEIEERIRPILAQRPERFDSLEAYVAHTTREYNELLWRHAYVVIANAVLGEDRIRKVSPAQTREISNIAGTLAREAILRDPAQYARHVFQHFVAMWLGLFRQGDLGASVALSTKDAIREYPEQLVSLIGEGRVAAALAGTVPAAQEQRSTFPKWLLRHSISSGVYRVLSELSFAISLVGCCVLFVARRLSGVERAWCVTALYVNAYMSGHALVQVYLDRYNEVMQPAVVGMLVLALTSAVSRARSRSAARATPSEGRESDAGEVLNP